LFVQIITGKRRFGCYHLGMRTAGFVLVGGRSSRMGQDKALLPWRNRTLVENIATKVRDAAGNVSLVGNPERYGAVPMHCLADRRPGLGPLSGIETALLSNCAELNLIVACDLLFLETDCLKSLIQTAIDGSSKCVVARDKAGQLHPLCGVYRSNCLSIVQRALDSGRLKLMEIIQELGAQHVDVKTPIWNVNTPEEWQRCRELANGG